MAHVFACLPCHRFRLQLICWLWGGRYAAMKRAGVRGVAWWHTGAVSYGDDNGNGESMWCASRAWGFFCCSSCASISFAQLLCGWDGLRGLVFVALRI